VNDSPSRENASDFRSTTETVCPAATSSRPSVEPTRPHPTITTSTVFSLVAWAHTARNACVVLRVTSVGGQLTQRVVNVAGF
jgi:hypothetical protein